MHAHGRGCIIRWDGYAAQVSLIDFAEKETSFPPAPADDAAAAAASLRALYPVITPGDAALLAGYVTAVLKLKTELQAAVLVDRAVGVEIGRTVADVYGTSAVVLRFALTCPQPVLAVCGVRGLAESVAVLCPDKKVLTVDGGPRNEDDLPSAAEVLGLQAKYPDVPVFIEVGAPAALKAVAGVITVSEAEAHAAVSEHPATTFMYLPDRNVARSLAELTGKTAVTWNFAPPVRDRFTSEQVQALRALHPDGFVLAHAGCNAEVIALSDALSFAPSLYGLPEGRPVIVIDDGAPVEALHASDSRTVLPAERYRCRNSSRITLTLLHRALQQMQPTVLPEELLPALAASHAGLLIAAPEPEAEPVAKPTRRRRAPRSAS